MSTWRTLYNSSMAHIPSGESEQPNTPFCLNLATLEGLVLPTVEVISAQNLRLQLSITFYNSQLRKCDGSTWRSSHIPVAQDKKSKMILNQMLYFHSPFVSMSTIMLIEVVAVDATSPLKQFSTGWTFLRVRDAESEGTKTKLQRLSVFQGSVRAIFFLSEPLPNSQMLVHEGFALTVYLNVHTPLRKVIHLLPTHSIFSKETLIPMLQGGGGGNLTKPKLMAPIPIFIEELEIKLGTNISTFEEHLLVFMNSDRLKRENKMKDGQQVQITERRLKTGVHNGHRFVEPPQILYLEKQNEILSAKGVISVTSLVADHGCSVVFLLEYVLQMPLTANSTALVASLRQTQVQTVVLRWGVWTPFGGNGSFISLQRTDLPLFGGPELNPEKHLTFTSRLRPMDSGSDSGEISFRFIKQEELEGREGSRARLNNSSSKKNLWRRGSYLASFNSNRSRRQSYDEDDDIPNVTMDAVAKVRSSAPPIGPVELMTPFKVLVPLQHSTPVVKQVQHQAPMEEMSYLPQQVPIVTVAQPSTESVSGLTRAGYAQLHNAGYPDLTDHEGRPALEQDLSKLDTFTSVLEDSDPMTCNELAFQFMAISWQPGPAVLHRNVFFTVQFYRFPQCSTPCLHVDTGAKVSEHSTLSLPAILRRTVPGNSAQLVKEPPGHIMRFNVDPAYFTTAEPLSLIYFLRSKQCSIDVWDAHSLLHIGSVAVRLKRLPRQGQHGVQITQELDILSTSTLDRGGTLVGDMMETGNVRAPGSSARLMGKLHLRIANIGSMSDPGKQKPGRPIQSLSHIINDEDVTNEGKEVIVRPRPLYEVDNNLAALLSNNHLSNPATASDARKRKLQRMENVRRALKDDNLILDKDEGRVMREKELQTIQSYRDRTQTDTIRTLLLGNLTVQHTLSVELGTVSFYELCFRNPFDREETFNISWECENISIISDSNEWAYHKQENNITTPLEQAMFKTDTSPAPLFLRPKEKVYIPFKYRSVSGDTGAVLHGPQSYPNTLTKMDSVDYQGDAAYLNPTTHRIQLSSANGQPACIVQLTVAPQPHIVDQTLRFYQAEQSFLKRLVCIPTSQFKAVAVQASNSSVVCSISTSKDSEQNPQVFIKAPVGPAGQITKFYIVLYNDKYCTKPAQTWQINVHSLQRVDISTVLGQTARLSVILRGQQAPRTVQCYSSHYSQLRILPEQFFMLMPRSIQEVHLSFCPEESGSKSYIVNIVDTEHRQLVSTWLISSTTAPPVIGKTFEVEIRTNANVSKNISFTNPYSTKRTFHVKSNRADIVRFKTGVLELEGGKSDNISMQFVPSGNACALDVLVFINDIDGNNEECFCLKVSYMN